MLNRLAPDIIRASLLLASTEFFIVVRHAIKCSSHGQNMMSKKFIWSTLLRNMQSNPYAPANRYRRKNAPPTRLLLHHVALFRDVQAVQELHQACQRTCYGLKGGLYLPSGYPCFVLCRSVGCRRRFARRSRWNFRTVGAHPSAMSIPRRQHLAA
jgi:hypothetical protein